MATRATAPDGLEWRVRRLVVPAWMRPVGLRAASEAFAASDRPGVGAPRLGGPAAAVGLVWALLALPLLPVVLALRKVGRVPWTVEAVARPWGRWGPPLVLRYEVRGAEASARAVRDLVAALERGDGPPDLAGAERVRD